jgi:hypothetical protein
VLSCLWSFSMLALDRVDGGVIIEHTHRSLRWQFSFDSWDLYRPLHCSHFVWFLCFVTQWTTFFFPSPLMHSINCRKENKGHSSTYLTHCGQTFPGLPCCYASLWCDSVSDFPEDCRYCGANVRLERLGHQHEQSLDATVEGTKSPCYWHVGENQHRMQSLKISSYSNCAMASEASLSKHFLFGFRCVANSVAGCCQCARGSGASGVSSRA